jgi:hypothetical protein
MHPEFAREYTLWDDSIRELSAWYGFSDKYFADKERWASSVVERQWTREPAVNVHRNVGPQRSLFLRQRQEVQEMLPQLTAPRPVWQTLASRLGDHKFAALLRRPRASAQQLPLAALAAGGILHVSRLRGLMRAVMTDTRLSPGASRMLRLIERR